MREHLYRGKRRDNGEWVEGFYCQFHNRPIIPEPNSHQIFRLLEDEKSIRFAGTSIGGIWEIIDPNTLGEFTGLTDKNGKKIFEGDIVSFVHDKSFDRPYKITRKYEVQFVNLFSQYGLRLKNKNIHFPFKQSTASMHDVEVIGNIHDNPELLEVQK